LKYFVIHIAFILTLILNWEILYSQNEIKIDNEIKITQTLLPGGNPKFQYEVNNRLLIVEKINVKWDDNQYVEKSKRIFRRKLTNDQINEIDSIIKNADLDNLDSTYYSAVMDGVIWIYDFKWGETSKKIELGNYYLDNLDQILTYINNLLPENKRFISFEIFNIKSHNNNR
jgi:hypothetical protein